MNNHREPYFTWNGVPIEGMAEDEFINIKRREYHLIDLGDYPESHVDYNPTLIKVEALNCSFCISKGSDTHKRLIEDDGKTEIKLELTEE